MSLNRLRCFFDVEVDGVPLGRIIFELFNDVCPKTTENFKALCTGEKGHGKTTGKALHYRNAKFHRVIKDFMIQAGDFSSGNGTGGESIYGGQFEDENFDIKHDMPFLLSMANRGKDTNGSQFFITTQTASHLDGKHVVFGRVMSGQEVVVSIENLPVDNRSRPLQQALISNCGELILQRSGQVKSKEKKKKKKKSEETATPGDDKKKKKKKKEKKHKQKKEKEKQSESEDQNEKNDQEEMVIQKANIQDSIVVTGHYKPHPLASVSVINPDEIPEVPKNRFLDRGFQNRRPDPKEEESEDRGRLKSKANVRFYTRSGRKVKGRGLLRYRTPSRSRSRSRSATPPHWRQAQRRTVTYEKYQRQTEEMEMREKEIEERRKKREERHRLLGMMEGEEEEEEGELPSLEGKLGSVIRGKFAADTGDENRTSRDWRVARHETFHDDKENVSDLRQKLKGKITGQSFAKLGLENKKRKDDVALDLDALDYEAPSDYDEDDSAEDKEGIKDDGEVAKKQLVKNGKENREKSLERDRRRDRDRERDRERRERRKPEGYRGRSWGRDRSRERGRDRERDRKDSHRRDRRSPRRKDSRDRKKRDDSRDRHRSSGKHREKERDRKNSSGSESGKN